MASDTGTAKRYQVKIQVDAWKCERCEHVWVPRSLDMNVEPKVCPKCKTPYWNVPRRMPKKTH